MYPPKIPPEALARQSDFVDALLADLPLLPGRGGWTVGDLILLKAVLDEMTTVLVGGNVELALPVREAALIKRALS